MKINVGIIGCGNAAYYIDEQINLAKRNSFSHLSVLKNNKKFNLLACCDKKIKNLNKFKKIFSFQYSYSSFSKMLSNPKINLLIIATPTKNHHSLVLKAINTKNIKIIICEKPFGFSYKIAKKIIEFSKLKNKILIINYQRRWDNFYKKIKTFITSEKLGRLKCIIGCVDKAMYQNSSHMLDMIVNLAGKISYVDGYKDISSGPRIVHDYKDFGGYIFAKHKNNIISFIRASADMKEKKMFEVDLHFSNGRIRVLDDDKYFEIYKFKKSNQYKGYKELKLFKIVQNKEEDRMKLLYNFIYKNFKKKKIKLHYDVMESIEPLKIIKKINKKI
jgi:predicted dehydrogenase